MLGAKKLKDLQISYDDRNESIQKVGVKNLKYPIEIKSNNGKVYHTIGTFSISVNLSSKIRGIHMSRFIEVLNDNILLISYEKVLDIIQQIGNVLNSNNVFFKVKFPYFIKKTAPISKKKSYLEYNVSYSSKLVNNKITCNLQVKIPVMTSCPCSKIISKYGAHNQRSIVTICIEIKKNMSIDEIIYLVEKSASSEIYALIKKPDEKYITESSYRNSKFVEDIVRDISLSMKKELKIISYKILSENIESIHNHNVFAYIKRG